MTTPQIPAERWVANLLEAAELIANRHYQVSRWLADDAQAWETPDEVICMLEDSVLEGFIEEYSKTFSPAQSMAVIAFRDEVDHYCGTAPQHLDPRDVLADPKWELVRRRASDFVQSFKNNWTHAQSK